MARPRTATAGLSAAACLALMLLAAAPAAGQELQPLVDRLDRIERSLNLLERQVYRGEPPPEAEKPVPPGAAGTEPSLASSVAARLEVRISELETQIRELTGKIEELTYGLGQLRQRLETETSDMEMRMSRLEEETAKPEAAGLAEVPAPPEAAGPAGEETQEAAAPPDAALPEGTPKEQYDHAFRLLVQQDFAAAETALKGFIEAHPEHELAANAQYWLGETYYARKDYAQAAVTFAEGYQSYKEGAKAPDNLLKLGMSLASLGETDQACRALAELKRRFPEGPQTIVERAAEERQRIGCK